MRDVAADAVADEMTHIYDVAGSSTVWHVKNGERKKSLSRWQQRKEPMEKVRWTLRLILSIKVRMQRTFITG